jgi:hypothetical protein
MTMEPLMDRIVNAIVLRLKPCWVCKRDREKESLRKEV